MIDILPQSEVTSFGSLLTDHEMTEKKIFANQVSDKVNEYNPLELGSLRDYFSEDLRMRKDLKMSE